MAMATVEAKTIWQGKVGIPEKYYRDALKKREDFKIFFRNGIMKIPYPELMERK